MKLRSEAVEVVHEEDEEQEMEENWVIIFKNTFNYLRVKVFYFRSYQVTNSNNLF